MKQAMRKSLFTILIGLLSNIVIAQNNNVGIGTTAPNKNAVLHIVSPNNNQGIMIPQLTEAQQNAISGLGNAELGLLLFNTTSNVFNYWDGAKWVAIGGSTSGQIQNLALSNDTLFIEDGNYVVLPSGTINTDDQKISISNDTIYLEDGGFVKLPSGVVDTDEQDLTGLLNGTELTINIEDGLGTTVDLLGLVNDADADTTNELQTLSLKSDTIFLSQGGHVVLPSGTIDTDDQAISISNDTIYLEDGGFVKLPSGVVDTDDQDLTGLLNGTQLTINIEDGLGTTVDLLGLVNDADADTTNELQTLSLKSDTIFLSQGGHVVLPSGTIDTDDQAISISNDTIYLEDGGFVKLPSGVVDTDDQDLTGLLNGTELTINIEDGLGTTVDLLGLVNDAEADTTNELQTLSLKSDTIFLSKGGHVVLPSGTIDTDDQAISISNDTIYLEDGGFVKLPSGVVDTDDQDLTGLLNGTELTINIEDGLGTTVDLLGLVNDADADTTNELQTLSLKSDTIFLSKGGHVVLPSGTIDTDDQAISISNDTIYLEDGGFVKLPSGVVDTDDQDLTGLLNGTELTINIEDGLGTTVDLLGLVNDADADSTNELQSLSLVADTIFLSDGGFVVLPSGTIDTDDQAISISNDTIFLEDGGFVKLPSGVIDTDDQDLIGLLNGTELTINIEDGLGTTVDLLGLVDDADADSTNELQTISLTSDTIFLSDGGFVKLPGGTVNTDDQAISISNDTIFLEDGGFVKLPAGVVDTDDQNLSLSNDTLFIEDGNFVKLSASISLVDNDGDTKIQVEETSDDDIIRFDLHGTEFFRMDSGRLEIVNTNENIFLGKNAGKNVDLSNSKGNVFIGEEVGRASQNGDLNVVLGHQSFVQNTIGNNNVGIGDSVLFNNTTGDANIAIGPRALKTNDWGSRNVAIGDLSLTSNTQGESNIAIGDKTLKANDGGDHNLALGAEALYKNNEGNQNIAVGNSSGYSNTTGNFNTHLGSFAGYENQTGSKNVFIGFTSGYNETGSDKLYIENTDSNEPLIYGNFADDSLIVYGSLSVKNEYTFPETDGSANQIMQTDGSGNVTWADLSSGGNDGDWFVEKTTNTPTDINQNIYHLGNLAIGQDSASSPLEVNGTDKNVILRTYSNLSSDIIGAIGISNYLEGSSKQSFSITGIDNEIFEGEAQEVIGVINRISTSGTTSGTARTVNSVFAAGNVNEATGTINSITSDADALCVGTINNLAGSSNNIQVGLRNNLNGTGNGEKVGIENIMSPEASGDFYGTKTWVPTSTARVDPESHRGAPGNVFGHHVSFTNAPAGQHCGFYANIPQLNSYAAFLLGRVALGSDSSNTYIFPESRGTNGQIMQTDGGGNVTWVDANDGGDADWYVEKTTSTASDINDNIYHLGHLAVGKDSADYPIDIQSSNKRIALNIVSDLNILPYSNPKGIRNTVNREVDQSNVTYGIENTISGAGKTSSTGISNYVQLDGDDFTDEAKGTTNIIWSNNSATGIGVHNRLMGSSNNNQIGVLNDLKGVGIAAKIGLQNNYASNSAEGNYFGSRTTADESPFNSWSKYGHYVSFPKNLGGTHYGIYTNVEKEGSFAGYFNGEVYISDSLGIGVENPNYQLELSQNSAAKPISSAWSVTSDARLKKDICDFNDGLDVLEQINPVWFTYNGEAGMPEETGVGAIAQEVQKVAPYMVKTWTYSEDDGTSTEYLTVDYGAIDFIHTNAIKELYQKILDQRLELEKLKAENAVLRSGANDMKDLKARLKAVEEILLQGASK